MKQFTVSALLVALFACLCNVQAFVPTTSSHNGVSVRPENSVKVFFFGGPKDDGSPGDYVCKVRSFYFSFPMDIVW